MLDSNLDFKEYIIQNMLNKVSKTIELLYKLQNILPRPPFITIYKSFITSYLDYGDIIYDEANNGSFHQKIESMQYNAALAIIGATRGTSREKLYNELSFEDDIITIVAFNKLSRLSHLGIYSTLFLHPKEP